MLTETQRFLFIAQAALDAHHSALLHLKGHKTENVVTQATWVADQAGYVTDAASLDSAIAELVERLKAELSEAEGKVAKQQEALKQDRKRTPKQTSKREAWLKGPSIWR